MQGGSNLGLSILGGGQWLGPGSRSLNPTPASLCVCVCVCVCVYARGRVPSAERGVPEPAPGPLLLTECAHSQLAVHGDPHQGTGGQTWPQSPSGLMWSLLDDSQPSS